MRRIALLPIAVALSAATPAGAAAVSEKSLRTGTAQMQEFSAARRQRKAPQAVPAIGATPPPAKWNGPDPTKGPGIARLRELQRQGFCVIDEGYGRYTFCSNM